MALIVWSVAWFHSSNASGWAFHPSKETQYGPHVASAHRFKFWFGRLTAGRGRRLPFACTIKRVPHTHTYYHKYISVSPGINGRGQAQVNGHEGQTEEPKRECNCDEELD